ncbi:MAG: UDP-N-acetylmuramoyl-tripeptide--D-alanyl-D-alanine ligase [Candidatus Sungbacteria bacterium]|nr:UDP-N-acetylmuramoyl-tripeptide--D-alanyl-D-alanine ligase [Candidatus Sungbacteria bacterium]
MNPLFYLIRHLYLLQLESYDITRYAAAIRRGALSVEPRKALVWTPKTIFLFVIAILLILAIAAGIGWLVLAYVGSILIGLLTFLLLICLGVRAPFIGISMGAFLILPVDMLLKKIYVSRARRKMQNLPHVRVIGIAGSYGKTTMKEVLSVILGAKFRVLKTPENINTPLGIARLILDTLTPDIEIFVVEMGAYQRGDIRAICDIVKPEISILTGINESHRERFGSLQATVAAKFEIVEATKPDGVVVFNADDTSVMEHYMLSAGERKIFFYSAKDDGRAYFKTSGLRFDSDTLTASFRLEHGGTREDFRINLLGEYAVGTVSGAMVVASILEVPFSKARRAAAFLQPVPHRLQPIRTNSDILVIDDSYNGNPRGVHEAILLLSKFRSRRKIFLTPGLVEMGGQSDAVHSAIGRELAGVADVVILIKNSVTQCIAEGLKEAGFEGKRLVWFDSANDAHKALRSLLRPGDVLLLQNDWTDNYQ